MKKIAILGSTGSIGTQTLEVVRENGDIEVLGLAAGSNIKMQEGLLNTYLESGFFPEWASPGHRGCMVGRKSRRITC